MPPTY